MIKFTGLNLLALFIAFVGSLEATDTGRSFVIDYEKNSFYMDGKPFRYVSGSAHYFRVPNEYWRDRLRKIRAAGLNAVSTYVEWSLHEAAPGHYNFQGDLNLIKFIQIAHEEDLFVILRPGPYICAERDLGGLPYWLLKYPGIVLRSSDVNYKTHVETWIDFLMKKLTPLFYGNGGPIIMVQVENEYGSYFSCDKNYTIWLRDLFKKHVKNSAVLFTTDGAGQGFLKCGKIPGVYATVDFGPQENVTKSFLAQRKFEPKGPLVNSEFYPGWLTHWGEKMARTKIPPILKTLKEMLDKGANVNFYMFHGGTNFGFTAGANMFKEYQSDITSYDYDAPISEAGDLTEKYYAIKNTVLQYLPNPNISVNSSKKGDYGPITFQKVATLFSPLLREKLGVLSHSENPIAFEDLSHNQGYVLYEVKVPKNEFPYEASKYQLEIKKCRDLAHIYYNKKYIGNMSREFKTDKLEIDTSKEGILSIIVENLGRINFGKYLNDKKGILSPVKLQQKELKHWNMTAFSFEDLDVINKCAQNTKLNGSNDCDNDEGFAFYFAKFTLPVEINQTTHPSDTFLDVRPITKGLVFINGFNLGRYWSTRGPQYAIYIPGVYLKPNPQENIMVMMDENLKNDSIKLHFTESSILI